MRFLEIGNTRGKECDTFSFRVSFTEKDVRMALRSIITDNFYREKVAFSKHEMCIELSSYICSVCKIKLSKTYMDLVGEWAFRTAKRHGFIFQSSYDGEPLWLVNDTKLGIGVKTGPQKTGERVLE